MMGKIKTVAAMTNEDLCALAGELGQTYVENEPSGELFGIVLVEQAARFGRMIRAAGRFTAEAQRAQSIAEGEGFP